MRRQAHDDCGQAVLQADLDRPFAKHGGPKALVLVEGGAVVVTGGQGGRVDRHLQHHRTLGFTRAHHQLRRRRRTQMRRPETARPRHKTFDFGAWPDHGDFFLVTRAFGKHAQLEHRALAGGKVNDHISVVQNVGHAFGIAFVLVVVLGRGRSINTHRLALREMPHQVKEVAAFFDQRAARVAVKAVPVADFDQKGKAVLANAEQRHRPGVGL